jgi:hypothetical protein
LEEILGVHRSVGFLSQTLQQAGEVAAAQNQKLSPPQPVLGEADEIFQGHQPCLTVVDGRSFLVLQLSPQPSRDATTWGVSFLELQEQGIEFQDIACDGALGIRSGVEQAGLSIPLRWDLFHVIREAHRLARRLETAAYRAMEQTEKVRRAEAEAHAPKRRRGRPLKVNQSLIQAQQHEQTAIDRYDLFVWLQRELRAVLEPWTSTCTLTCPTHAQQTLEVVVTLLQELGDAHISQYAQTIQAQQEELLAPLRWVVTQLMPWRQAIDPKQEALIIWAFKHRHTLEIEDPTQGFPQDQHPLVNAFWETLSLFHRSSSLAESLHSWLRPYLQVHRGMPPWLMALLQLYWNHHRFQRGIRKGNTPLELAGVNEGSSWSEVLDHLLEDQEQQPIHTQRKAA